MMKMFRSNCVRSIVILATLFLWETVGDDPQGSCDTREEKNDCNDDNNKYDADKRLIWDTESCHSKVVLIEGYPDNERTHHETSLLQKPITTADDDDDAAAAAHFPIVSRYSSDFEASNFTEDRNILHISPNGDHEGWFVFVPHFKCLHVAKQLIAREIVALRRPTNTYYKDDDGDEVMKVDLRGPHRLVDEEGKLVENPFQINHSNNNNNNDDDDDNNPYASRRLHLLLPRETFVHQAVREGFVRTLSDGTTTLTTLSLVPRIFVIDPILSEAQCQEIIQYSSNAFHRSSEHHYSDEFKNYRTSLSARTPRHSQAAQYLWKRVKDITAVPSGAAEQPQPLKYETHTSWYKVHMDYFHAFQNKPLEEVRMFVKTRTQELLHLNLLPSDIKNMLVKYHRTDEESSSSSSSSLVVDLFAEFDGPIERPLHPKLAKILVERLELTSENNHRHHDERIVLHNFVVHSRNPRHYFTSVATQYAAAFLQFLGVTDTDDATSLAETYFRMKQHDTISHDENGLEQTIQDYVPYVYKPIQTNRHVTVLPILQAADRGGHTAFPRSTSSTTGFGIEPDPEEQLKECRHGLIVKPKAGQALMFYNRLPEGQLDPMSEHAGCPTQEGEKFAANCFTWDSDQSWAWKFHQQLDELYRLGVDLEEWILNNGLNIGLGALRSFP